MSDQVGRAPRFDNLPDHMKHLPLDHRGFPVPWFVAKINGEWDFRVVRKGGIADAWNKRLCWVCGEPLGRFRTFVIGPMCAVNRTSSEPPSHTDCARFSAMACPFLTRPKMRRNQKDMPKDTATAGIMIDRNLGVTLMWTTLNPKPFKVENGWLFNIGDPVSVEWYAEGRTATRDEVAASFQTGLPFLRDMCDKDDDPVGAKIELARREGEAMKLWPAAA